ncbi:hypothetical protein SLNSH_00015 [Alsobacter soli]|uniref:Uncharacterized protein n=1 Tax=Alsobacter soli TaxID=2109933 RepID=A0A2T1HYX1_9HYPH|nr:hypothetical protein [Alsobacter soli]PSC06815.1 hypothetical protein SLNSH_00015 [Alsobacter soli]
MSRTKSAVAAVGLGLVALSGVAAAPAAAVEYRTSSGELRSTERWSAEQRMPAERWTLPYKAYPENIPACADPAVLGKIQDRFAETEATYWAGAQIVAFEKVRPLGFRPWGLDFIPRLFCTGTVVVTDGRRHRIDYSLAEDTGFIGYGWGVEYCVNGYDKSWAYAPACKMARP